MLVIFIYYYMKLLAMLVFLFYYMELKHGYMRVRGQWTVVNAQSVGR